MIELTPSEKWKKVFRCIGGPYLALIVLFLICALTNDVFAKPANLINILRQVSYSGMIALGMTFVIVGGGIDLSVGSLFALCGVFSVLAANHVTPWVMQSMEGFLPGSDLTGFLIAAIVSVLTGLVGALINGAVIVLGKLPPFIATLGTYSIFRSLSLYFADAGTLSTENPVISDFGSSSVFGFLPTPAFIMLLLTAVLGVLLSETSFGRHVCAVGSNERVARYAGIHTGRTQFLTYAVIGLCVGISAFLFVGRLSSVSSSNAGLLYELDAIAAVIIGGAAMSGGRGSLWGTLGGVLILGIVSNILDMWGVSVNLQGTVKGLVIIISVLIQRKDHAS